MNIEQLFHMQKMLDDRIQSEHQLLNKDLMEKKILAFSVELGELANETRCFKFWSKKQPSPTSVILEEYVDGIHFILSLGLEIGVEKEFYETNSNSELDLVGQFLIINELLLKFRNNPTLESYVTLFNEYLWLGQLLGFSKEEIVTAYMKKNEVNHKRQDQGY